MSVAMTEPHTSTNGVVKIPRRGTKNFQFGDEEPQFQVDVIAVYDDYIATVEWALRDKDGNLPHDKQREHGQNRLNFVQAVVNDSYARLPNNPTPPTLNRAEAEFFVAAIFKEVETLRNFLYPKKEDHSSAPENTAPETQVRFSQ